MATAALEELADAAELDELAVVEPVAEAEAAEEEPVLEAVAEALADELVVDDSAEDAFLSPQTTDLQAVMPSRSFG